MKKINTKGFGPKNLLEQNPIDGTDELFIGEISYNHEGSRYRLRGIIDKNYREVVPFGELHRVIGTRIVNDNIVIIDCVSVAGNYDIGWDDDYGSILLMRDNEGFKIAYNSNASIMYATNNMLFGANYEAPSVDVYLQQYADTSYPVETFEYDYVDNCLINREKLGEVTTSQIQEYFYSKLLPYPDKMGRFEDVGTINGKYAYLFKRH